MSKNYRTGYSHKLVNGRKEEFSFEEIRARHYASCTPRVVDDKTELRMERSELLREVAELRTQKENLSREIEKLCLARDELLSRVASGVSRHTPVNSPYRNPGPNQSPTVEIARGGGAGTTFEDSFDDDEGGIMIRPDTGVIDKHVIHQFPVTPYEDVEETPEATTEIELPNGDILIECYSSQELKKAYRQSEQDAQKYDEFISCDGYVPRPSPGDELKLGTWLISVEKRIGGTDALGVWYGERVDDESYEEEETDVVVKFSDRARAVWELYILKTAQKRIHRSMKDHFVCTHALYQYHDGAVAVMDRIEHDNLASAIDLYQREGRHMEETLAVYYAIELIKLVHRLHQANIVHGNIRPEHVLIRNLNSDKTQLWDQWEPSGVAGWDTLGVYLVDFSRALDLNMFGPNTTFVGAYPGTAITEQCPAAKANRPWTRQPDYYGIAAVVYYMLTGTTMTTVGKRVGSIKPRDIADTRGQDLSYPEVWEPLFESFLNIRDCRSLPDLEEEQHRLEDFLVSDTRRARSVRTLLVQQNIMIYDGR